MRRAREKDVAWDCFNPSGSQGKTTHRGSAMRSLESRTEKAIQQSTRISLANTVVMRQFVSETVLMDINSGEYYRLDTNSGLMVRALIEEGSIEGAIRRMGALGISSEEELRIELVTLYTKLRALKLVW